MKKIFALILILAMLIPFVVACDGGDDTTTTTTTEIIDYDKFTSKNTVKKDWEGETLLVAATAWSGNPSYPWSTMELAIEEGKTSGWGEKIDKAVLERTAYIKATYGVDVIWEHSSRYNTHDVLKNAMMAGNDPDYDLAMPRAMRAHSIVANGSVYDMANRPYINFNNSYYNQESVETYTAKGHTFFITGDFSNLDKETAFVVFVNKTVLGGEEELTKLYQLVKDGKWTWDKLVTYASAAFKDNGNNILDDVDIYGLSTQSFTRFYEYFGVKQAGTDKSTGEWKITLNDPKVNDIIDAIIEANSSDWARSAWAGVWESLSKDAYAENRILFFNEAIQRIKYITESMPVDNLGVIPFPMLNEEQGRFCVPCSSQQFTLLCIPKTTSDRNMSDYFVDVLAWTGNEYVMKAYYDQMAEQLGAEEMEIMQNYIIPNITYDAGAAIGWNTLIGDVIEESYRKNEINFEEVYAEHEADALKIIKEWNEAWGGYTE
ncbi:MAG: extracellular solute-binding protein [Clostridia bacterium]|nr:extracellular solute-binding protein [Clostridia bacterium]